MKGIAIFYFFWSNFFITDETEDGPDMRMGM
jgi:hypothetical protein